MSPSCGVTARLLGTRGHAGRVMRTALLTAMIALALSAPVSAHLSAENPVEATWLAHSRMPLPRSSESIVDGACPGADPALVSGCSYGDVIYVSRGGRHTLFHEVGHAFDRNVLRTRDREAFKAMMGDRGRRWFPSGDTIYIDDLAAPAEKFAETYAICSMHGSWRRALARGIRPSYGLELSERQFAHACRLIQVAGARLLTSR